MELGTKALCVVVVLCAAAASFAQDAAPEPERHIDLAICLDTSGSMTGLINSARQKLWDIVNELALAQPTPVFRVALLTYGSPDYPSEDGWVVEQVGLTDDLDTVYQKLFALHTRGGTEYVGRVVHRAATSLQWSGGRDALKIIFVAGNESADQDKTVRYTHACKGAISKGIIVNSIYCGGADDGIASGWREVAALADGQFACIDQNGGTVAIATPFDKQLAELSAELNKTYVAYGHFAHEGITNQVAQDANASKMSGAAAASRAVAKANAFYNNDRWDLVDASRRKDFDLTQIKADDLPEGMRQMSLEQRKAHLEQMAEQRVQVQKQINDINAKRLAHIDEQLKKMANKGDSTFDLAVRKALRTQAARRNFTFAQ